MAKQKPSPPRSLSVHPKGNNPSTDGAPSKPTPTRPKSTAKTDASVKKRRAPKSRREARAVPTTHPSPLRVAPDPAPLMNNQRDNIQPSNKSRSPKPISKEDQADLEAQEKALSDLLAKRAGLEEAMIQKNRESRSLAAEYLGPSDRKGSKKAPSITTQVQVTRMLAREVYNGIPESECNPDPEGIEVDDSD